jgi:hypothetical protein
VGQGFQVSSEKINHASANKYPAEVDKYITKEREAGALHIIDRTKLNQFHVSPLMSHPKEGT